MDVQQQTDLKEYADRLEFICRAQKDEIAKLRSEIERLRAEGGAHAALKDVYLDRDLPEALRVKAATAALPHETPKLMSVPPPLELAAEETIPLAQLVEQRRARQNSLCPQSASDLPPVEVLPIADDRHRNGNGGNGNDHGGD
jgi:hypothetical protein